jgi:hypothetical protein
MEQVAEGGQGFVGGQEHRLGLSFTHKVRQTSAQIS